jgi:hypothetical protein
MTLRLRAVRWAARFRLAKPLRVKRGDRSPTLKVIAVCSALSTTVLVGGAIFLLNDRYDWTGQLREWNNQRLVDGSNKQLWNFETNQARLLVGDEKLAFIVHVCVPGQPIWVAQTGSMPVASAISRRT